MTVTIVFEQGPWPSNDPLPIAPYYLAVPVVFATESKQPSLTSWAYHGVFDIRAPQERTKRQWGGPQKVRTAQRSQGLGPNTARAGLVRSCLRSLQSWARQRIEQSPFSYMKLDYIIQLFYIASIHIVLQMILLCLVPAHFWD